MKSKNNSAKQKGFQNLKPTGEPLFPEVFKTKLEAATNLIWTIEGAIRSQEKKNKEAKKPQSIYTSAAKYLDCKIVAV